MEFIIKLSQSTCFKPLNERSNDRFLSYSTLFMAYYQQNVSKNEMRPQFGVRAHENLSVRLSQNTYFKLLNERSNSLL